MHHPAYEFWLFALWTPFYSWVCFRAAIEEYGDEMWWLTPTYFALGVFGVIVTIILIPLPWLV